MPWCLPEADTGLMGGVWALLAGLGRQCPPPRSARLWRAGARWWVEGPLVLGSELS